MKVKLNINGNEKIIKGLPTICHIPVLVEYLKEKLKTDKFIINEIDFYGE